MKIKRVIKIKLAIMMIMSVFVLVGCSDGANQKNTGHDDPSELEERFMSLEEDFNNLTVEYHNKISSLESELHALRTQNNDLQHDLMLPNSQSMRSQPLGLQCKRLLKHILL